MNNNSKEGTQYVEKKKRIVLRHMDVFWTCSCLNALASTPCTG